MANAMKGNQHVKPIIDVEKNEVRFVIADGGAELVLHMDLCAEVVRKRAALAGMAQVRIVDAAAVELQDDEGNVIPAEDRIATKRERMARLIAHYETGTTDWTLRQAGGGSARSLTVDAIARVKACSYEAADAYVTEYAARNYEGDRKECLAFLRDGKRIAEAMDAIRAERNAKRAHKVDADAALEEMGADDADATVAE